MYDNVNSIESTSLPSRLTYDFQTTHDANSCFPISPEKANALYNWLESIKHTIGTMLPEDVVDFWIVGEHGNNMTIVILFKNNYIAFGCTNVSSTIFPNLPKVSMSDGRHSLCYYMDDYITTYNNHIVLSTNGVNNISKRSRELFIYNATKQLPVAITPTTYDINKPSICVTSAESIATQAFRKATKRVSVVDDAIRDNWAKAALSYVVNDDINIPVLTQEGMNILNILRNHNVHLSKNDLISRYQVMQDKLEVDFICTYELETHNMPEEKAYTDARRSSYNAFLKSRNRVICGKGVNYKPFTQKMINGIILAKASQARLTIGHLSVVLSHTLIKEYGDVFLYMQDSEVWVTGRNIPELSSHRKGLGKVFGITLTKDLNDNILDHPLIVLDANCIILDTRTIYHECEHIRQACASEDLVSDFSRNGTYASDVIEFKAKRAEEHYINTFGMLY
jgi:hypothetical protein